jgi:hypothetical protein
MVELDDPRVRYQYENHSQWLFHPDERKRLKKFLVKYLDLVVPSETHLDSFAIPLSAASHWLKIPIRKLSVMLEAQHLRLGRDFAVRKGQIFINSQTLSQLLQMLPWDHPIGREARKYFAMMDHAYRNHAGETLRRNNKLEKELKGDEEENLEEPRYIEKIPASGNWSMKITGADGSPYITHGITSDANTTFQRHRLSMNELFASLPRQRNLT